jgi:hypothetical protein
LRRDMGGLPTSSDALVVGPRAFLISRLVVGGHLPAAHHRHVADLARVQLAHMHLCDDGPVAVAEPEVPHALLAEIRELRSPGVHRARCLP